MMNDFTSKAMVILLLSLPGLSWGAAAELQIICARGVRIYLDNRYLGVCTATDGGFFLQTSPGEHQLKATAPDRVTPFQHALNLKEGPNPDLELNFQDPKMIMRHPLAPPSSESELEKIKGLQSTRDGRRRATVVEASGTLTVRSVPPKPVAVIVLDGVIAGKTPAAVDGVRVGEREFRVVRNNQTISSRIVVKPNIEIKIKADFQKGKLQVENLEELGFNPLGSIVLPGERALYDLLDEYVNTLNRKDLDAHLKLFGRGVHWFFNDYNHTELRQILKRTFDAHNSLHMEFSNIMVEMEEDGQASATFDRYWNFHGVEGFCGKARTRFSFAFEDGKWKIVAAQDLDYYWLHYGDCSDK